MCNFYNFYADTFEIYRCYGQMARDITLRYMYAYDLDIHNSQIKFV